jgi:hypothetical protein
MRQDRVYLKIAPSTRPKSQANRKPGFFTIAKGAEQVKVLRALGRCALIGSTLALLAACGAGNGGGGSHAEPAGASPGTPAPAAHPSLPSAAGMTQADAVRLADQASFGPTESLVNELRARGAEDWISMQLQSDVSRYTSGKGDAVHKNVSETFFCEQGAQIDPQCWRDWFSTTPLLWDFYRNAISQPDQLRQRMAFALQQIVVVSNLEVSGTYGFRNHYNNLLRNALGNYRDVLKRTALSPLMGDFLNNVNNDKQAPNENFGRELLQLFSIGTCKLNIDGSLLGGKCQPTYDNATVRSYAYALTGWTYPIGGSTAWGCWPQGANCQYYVGDMVPVAVFHDDQARTLLSGLTKPANSTAASALELVLDSLMAHPNMAPFVSRQLIQALVSSNPSAAYVQRVATVFNAGRFTGPRQTTFGAGLRGDLAATAAAILLDPEARGSNLTASAGRLRDPVQFMAGVLRAMNGHSDGDAPACVSPTLGLQLLPAQLPGGGHLATGPSLWHP